MVPSGKNLRRWNAEIPNLDQPVCSRRAGAGHDVTSAKVEALVQDAGSTRRQNEHTSELVFPAVDNTQFIAKDLNSAFYQ